MDRDAKTRARIEQHWEASERGDGETEHAIYAEDAILARSAGRGCHELVMGGLSLIVRFPLLDRVSLRRGQRT